MLYRIVILILTERKKKRNNNTKTNVNCARQIRETKKNGEKTKETQN